MPGSACNEFEVQNTASVCYLCGHTVNVRLTFHSVEELVGIDYLTFKSTASDSESELVVLVVILGY